MTKQLPVFLLVISLLFICQCALPKQVPLSYEASEDSFLWPSEDLKETFIKYWTLRSEKRHEASFKMEAPYLQEIVPPAVYKSYVVNEETRVDGVKLLRINMDISDCCVVAIKLSISKENEKPKEVFLSDQWVKVGGGWFHIIKDPVMRNFFP